MHGFLDSRAGKAVLGASIGAALAIAVVLLACAGVAGASGGQAVVAPAGVPAGQAGGNPAPGSIVVVRRSAGHDALWSVDPVSAAATELVALPFRPTEVEQSPGGRRLAYLPTAAGSKVYVYDTQTGALHAWSLAARGVRAVDSLAWLSSTKLVVAGKSTRGFAFYPYSDRLYVLNAATGASRRYGSLTGTEPTVAPAAKRLVYVRLSRGGVERGGGERLVIERLYRLKLAAGAKPHLIGSAKYVYEDIRRFRDPRLSRDGAYLITSTSGSDVSVSYMVRSAVTGRVLKRVDTQLGDTTAWSNLGDQVSFWGLPIASPQTTSVLYIYHAATKSLSTSGKLSSIDVAGLSWSSDDALLAYGLIGSSSSDYHPDVAELWTLDPASLGSQTDLGRGGLPVFMP
jgi:hypothetical protein